MSEKPQRSFFVGNRLRVLLALTFIVGIFALVGFVTSPRATANATTSKNENAQYEISFMEYLIDHHYSGILIDQQCVQKATHGKLIEMCKQGITSQQMQIKQMQSWLSQWYGIHYTPQLDAQGQAFVDAISALPSGRTFEIEFMSNLITHHLSAVIPSQTCQSKASHDQLRDLCSKVVSMQSMEITMLKDYLCDWYALCEK